MNAEAFIPMLIIFSIPILAIVGGTISGILKSVGQQRLLELAQRERMMAIERGIPPEKLPPLQFPASGELGLTFAQQQLRRSHGLMIGGLISLGIGMGMIVFLQMIPDAADKNVWGVGLVPAFVGVACILSGWIVRPRGDV